MWRKEKWEYCRSMRKDREREIFCKNGFTFEIWGFIFVILFETLDNKWRDDLNMQWLSNLQLLEAMETSFLLCFSLEQSVEFISVTIDEQYRWRSYSSCCCRPSARLSSFFCRWKLASSKGKIILGCRRELIGKIIVIINNWKRNC